MSAPPAEAPRAEVLKLARLLGDAAPGDLAFLDEVGDEELRAYRERLTEGLYALDSGPLQRAADSARLLPTGAIASIATGGLGPLLAARICGRMDLGRAAEVAAKLPPAFLAEVAAELDPRLAPELVPAIDEQAVVEAATAMAAAGEHVAMGRFVGHLPAAMLAACVAALSEEDLLRIAYVMEAPERIDAITAMLSDERLTALAARGEEEGLRVAAATLAAHLGPQQSARLERLRR